MIWYLHADPHMADHDLYSAKLDYRQAQPPRAPLWKWAMWVVFLVAGFFLIFGILIPLILWGLILLSGGDR